MLFLRCLMITGFSELVILAGCATCEDGRLVSMSSIFAGIELFSRSRVSVSAELSHAISRGIGEILNTPYDTA